MKALKWNYKTLIFTIITIIFSLAAAGQTGLYAGSQDVDRLVSALLKETPIIEDLQQLCDEIGGRPTGSKANLQSVEWALNRFKEAGVTAKKEAFMMYGLWLERSASAMVSGDVSFKAHVAGMTYSLATPPAGLKAPLKSIGFGTEADFKRLGSKIKGAFILVETNELTGIGGLLNEYVTAADINERALAAGVAGVVYMSSRPRGLLYRYGASASVANKLSMVVMEREQAKRLVRLLEKGKKLDLTAKLDFQSGGPYESYNVIGEIKGSEKPEEIVVIGAHLDAFGLGAGANDNGCNVVMMIDIARQMKKLGIRPKRTIRFALWNGEEQGFVGSWKYTRQHLKEMDNHIMACSIDIGSGRIKGFFTNGREELMEPVNRALEPVAGLGPFQQVNVPVVGTDNYDFMMQGVANLIADHEEATYAANYHAESDTFDKVDQRQIKLNTAIVAALVYGFADMKVTWKRQTRKDIQAIIDNFNLKPQMKFGNLYPGWLDGSRGRK
jgi:hypothetical protein